MWNRLPNHAHYGDEGFAGDSVGLGLGQRLNFISKKLILMGEGFILLTRGYGFMGGVPPPF